MGAFQMIDRVAVGDNKFLMSETEDGRVILEPSPDNVIKEGTPLNRATLQPLFDNEFDSAFVFNLSDDDTVTPANGKTIAEFFNAVQNNHNTVAYGVKNGILRTIFTPEVVLLNQVILVQSTSSQYWKVHWLLNETKMERLDDYYLAPGFVRILDENDDLNDIVAEGIYTYRTASIPKNCPFVNAGVVEIFGNMTADNDQKIQRVTRYGDAGDSAWRGLASGEFTAWAYNTAIVEEDIVKTTSNLGNCSLGLSLDSTVLLSAYCAAGNVAHMCIPYRANTTRTWAVKVLDIENMTPVANTEVTITCFYTKNH